MYGLYVFNEVILCALILKKIRLLGWKYIKQHSKDTAISLFIKFENTLINYDPHTVVKSYKSKIILNK